MHRHLFSGMMLLFAIIMVNRPVMAQLVSAQSNAGKTAPQRMTPSLPIKSTLLTSAPSDPVAGKLLRVGLLVPLTGRNADIGRAMQDAATVALYDKYASLSLQQSTVRIELLPKDTGDTPEQAATAATQAIEQGAQFLIGPIFSDATQAVLEIARAKNISLLSFSNNVTNAGKGVYAYGFSPQDQAARIVTFAMKSGKSRIAVLAPNSPLGLSVIAAAKEALSSNGQTLVAEATYASQGLGIDAAVNKLIPPGSAPDFNGLLVVEAGPTLNTLLRALSTRGATLPDVQLLGLGMWDDAALIRRAPLDGAWLASSPPSETATFENHFRRTYNYTPPRIASLSYDAVSLVVTLATSGRPLDTATLANDTGFNGPANGIFRLRPNGKTERGLAVLQVDGINFKTLSPAPKSFGAK